MPEPQSAQPPAQKKPVAEGQAEPQIKTCASCSKPLKRVKRYYRNGQYYCNKNCWRASQKKDRSTQETQEAAKG